MDPRHRRVLPVDPHAGGNDHGRDTGPAGGTQPLQGDRQGRPTHKTQALLGEHNRFKVTAKVGHTRDTGPAGGTQPLQGDRQGRPTRDTGPAGGTQPLQGDRQGRPTHETQALLGEHNHFKVTAKVGLHTRHRPCWGNTTTSR